MRGSRRLRPSLVFLDTGMLVDVDVDVEVDVDVDLYVYVEIVRRFCCCWVTEYMLMICIRSYKCK